MRIELPPEVEEIAKSAVSAGAYETVADFIAAVVREKGAELPEETAQPRLEKARWVKRLHEIAASHEPTGYPVDDSRESIYPDRA